MPNYLLEIGTEELPAGHIPEAERKLCELIVDALKTASLKYDKIQSMSTPRRLTVIVSGLDATQATTTSKKKGPPAKSSFDDKGNPTPAASGFAAKNGIAVDQLEREEIGGVEYIIANLTIVGKSAAQVLSEFVPKVIMQLSGERLMRWGDSDLKFSRPIRWIVSLLDNQVVNFNLEGIEAGRHTTGHRILAPGKIELNSAEDYVSKLKAAKVLVEPQARKKVIEDEVLQLAKSLNGKAKQVSGPLLEEVVNITEWPKAVVGDFASEYLDLPDALIETIMIHHQRYFPIERSDASDSSSTVNKNSLLPHFIAIANNDREEARAQIKQGNERVLKARLADGRFFYFDDQKTKLTDRKPALALLTFQHGLGSYGDKVERMVAQARLLASTLKLEAKYAVPLEKTMELCKLDLVTNLVRELPELQGYVGAWYAEQEGQPPEVARALASHYSPRSTEDTIPKDTVGQLASVLDKLDSLVGLFALGMRPSGSSDPFALRRQAQGIVDVLIDGLPDYAINLSALIDSQIDLFDHALKETKHSVDKAKAKTDLHEFLLQRLKGKLVDLGIAREVADSVLSSRDPFENLKDVIIRCRCVEKLLTDPAGVDLVRTANRISSILQEDSPSKVNESDLTLEPEERLWQTFKDCRIQWQGAANGKLKTPETAQDYERLLATLAPLPKPVDEFFTSLMVNDKDKQKRDNRHAILKNIDQYFKLIADFPKLQSLIV